VICLWSYGPANERVDQYLLSTDQARRHWILWLVSPGDGMVLKGPVAWSSRHGAEVEAARALLAAAWRGERDEYGTTYASGLSHVIPGLLTENEIQELARAIDGEALPEF
jgi:hypothetical protein